MSVFKRIIKSLFSAEELEGKSAIKNEIFEIPFDKDKIQIISMPKIGNESFKITKWFCKVEENIKEGKAICELENKNTTLEFESYISGKIVSITKKTSVLNTGDEICKIENI